MNEPLRKFELANIVLLLVSVISVLVVAEGAYRLYLRSRSILSYTVASKSICEFDSAFGYRYVPNSVATTLSIRSGSPTIYGRVSVGPYSNFGDGVRSWEEKDLKILAFGDSFTANPYSYFSWTDYLAENLKADNQDIKVMNFGRDGYGVLQMVHFANAMVKEFRPDIVIVAFIMDDLSRARFWRTMKRIDGEDRLLTTILPTSDPEMSMAEDVTLIVPQLTLEWCNSAASGQSKSDPFLDVLHGQFRRLADENFSEGLASLSTVFLYNRIVHHDPFYSIRKPAHFAKMGLWGFEQDPAFVSDMTSLMNQQTPVYWVMLPTMDEMQAGKYIRDPQQEKLFESLVKFMKGSNKLIDLLSIAKRPTEATERLFLLPHDLHPSETGSRFYAKAIAMALQ